MKHTLRFVLSFTALLFGCRSADPTGTGGAGSGATTTSSSTSASSSKSSSVASTTAGAGGGMQTPCNPVADTECNLAAGQACDFGLSAAFECWTPPPANTADICATCSTKITLCKDGSTCLPADGSGTVSKCVRFCCTDADCGGDPGSCAKDPNFDPKVGLCATFVGGGGAGGGGPYVSPRCTGIPASPPSNGACSVP